MDPDLRRKERARGFILKILMQSYPNAMDESVVFFTLNDLGMEMSRDSFNFHLGYLIEKKMIREEKRSAGKIHIRMVAATSHGVDVMDGRIPDCGVDIDC